jgi:hypothetical protein
MGRIEQHHAYLASSLPVAELRAALSHPNWEIRAAVVRSLSQRGEPGPVLTALQDEHHLVRATAVSVLDTFGARFPLERLVLASRDSAWEVREMAVLVLGRLGEQGQHATRSLLQAALHDSSERVREAARISLQALTVPPSLVPTRPAWARALAACRRTLFHLWLVLWKQVSVMHRSIWTVTALVMLLGGVLALINLFVYPLYSATLSAGVLTLLVLAASATGAACIYGQEHDSGMEIALGTPTSLRTVLLFRLGLVLVYNILLALGVSTLIAVVNGGGIWPIVQIWLVPLLCLSSLSLLLSVLTNALLAVQMTLLLEFIQALVIVLEKFAPTGQVATLLPALHQVNWSQVSTSPALLLLAALCVGLAVFYAPRQTRLPG